MTIPPPPNAPNLDALPEAFRHAEYCITRPMNAFDARITTPDRACRFYCRPVSFTIDSYDIIDHKKARLLRIKSLSTFQLKERFEIEDAEATQHGLLRRATRRYDRPVLWEVVDAEGVIVALVQEKDAGLALARRIVGNWVPQTYLFNTEDGQELARCERTFWHYHLTLYHDWRSIVLDPRLALVAALFLTR
jgi:hypothetical protein